MLFGRSWKSGASVMALLLLAGCGSGRSRNNPTGEVRFVHFSPNLGNVDIYADTTDSPLLGNQIHGNLKYKDATGYDEAQSRVRTIRFYQAGIDAVGRDPLRSAVFAVQQNKRYTVMLAGRLANGGVVPFEDSQDATREGFGRFRVAQASQTLTPMDIYITEPNTALASVTPQFRNLTIGGATSYLQLEAKRYRVRLTTPGTKTVKADSGAQGFLIDNHSIRTMFVHGDTGLTPPVPIEFTVLNDN